MRIEIDQSGKVEDTAKPTVLAYVGSESRAIIIPASGKRKLQELYRRIGQPRLFVYQVFALGVYRLIRHMRQARAIVIDIEYPGKEKMLKGMIMTLLSVHGHPEHDISFARIGSHPPVHYAAKDVFDRKKPADEVVTVEKLLQSIKKPDERLRGCFATLVDAQGRTFDTHYIRKSKNVKKKDRGR